MSTGIEPRATADLVDEHGDNLDSIDVQFRSFGRHSRFAGAAVTVRCFEDNVLLKQTLAEHPEPQGKVLIVDGGGSYRTALVGDVIASIAVDRGWAGIIVHGCIRDSAAINELPIGVKALGTNPRKSGKSGAGTVGDLIEIGGARIRDGQHVYCDEDGIVVLPRA